LWQLHERLLWTIHQESSSFLPPKLVIVLENQRVCPHLWLGTNALSKLLLPIQITSGCLFVRCCQFYCNRFLVFYSWGQVYRHLCQHDGAPIDLLSLVCLIKGNGYLVTKIGSPLLLVDNLQDCCELGMIFFFHPDCGPLLLFDKCI
jgi:hypothetical protein